MHPTTSRPLADILFDILAGMGCQCVAGPAPRETGRDSFGNTYDVHCECWSCDMAREARAALAEAAPITDEMARRLRHASGRDTDQVRELYPTMGQAEAALRRLLLRPAERLTVRRLILHRALRTASPDVRARILRALVR